MIRLAVNTRQQNGNTTDNMRRKMRENVCIPLCNTPLRTVCLLLKVYIKLAETHSPPAQMSITARNTCQVKLLDENLFHQPPSDLADLGNRGVALIRKDTKQKVV